MAASTHWNAYPDNPALRQTVVNVLCAYLRAPFG